MAFSLIIDNGGLSNSRFEPTPHHGIHRPGYEAAVNSFTRAAGRSAILNQLMAAHRPATRGSSARR